MSFQFYFFKFILFITFFLLLLYEYELSNVLKEKNMLYKHCKMFYHKLN